MPLLDLGSLALGDRVQHSLRVIERTEKTKANGEPFVILTLGNASGRIETKPVWTNQLDDGWAAGADVGTVVQAIGNIASYQSRRQLELTAPLRLLPRESLRLEEFLPSIEADPARLWSYIDRFRMEIGSPKLRRVVDLFFADEAFRLRFERVPASINGHHGKLGGLLLHVTEVARIARTMSRAMEADGDLVMAGALLHDIGKIEAYQVGWDGFSRTPCGHLIEHVVLGALMLERALAALGEPICSPDQLLDLQHLILSHHGELEFGSPVRPLTLEAEILHHADNASAKASDVAECLAEDSAFRDGDAFPTDRSRLWRVDRRSLWRRPHHWD